MLCTYGYIELTSKKDFEIERFTWLNLDLKFLNHSGKVVIIFFGFQSVMPLSKGILSQNPLQKP